MRHILMLFTCLVAGPLAAETIGNVEYHLPKQGQGWRIANELQGRQDKSTTIIYIPENRSLEDAKESFGVHVNDFSTDLTDKDSLQRGIEKGMQLKFANPKATITLIDATPQSILYEWSVSDSGQEKVHGWTRVFSAPHETVMLTYQTEQLNNINDKQLIWIEALEDAKALPSPKNIK